ncbi:uncharacterized protein LOC115951906 [Quercus lobata]|uniref:Uncharacterized protein n=1 Tax=Quercus lobata TaxID=97700 RepID=A0A7N2M4X3_QUELO|nr:uncharacterized protein LOC115951906 [Quercus lobata]
MENSILSRDSKLEESFSFSCYDFNTAVSFFSEEEDCGNEDDDDDESYIEIALDDDDHKDGKHDEEADAFELRISYSSPNIVFNELPTHSLTDTKIQDLGFETHTIIETPSSCSSSSSTLSCSSTETCSTGPPVPHVSPQPWGIHNSAVRQGAEFPAVNEQVNTLPFSLDEENCLPQKNQQILIDTYQWDLVGSSKTSNNRTTMSGGIMKLFIKFRAMNVRTLLATFMKSRQVISSPGSSDHKKKKSKERLVKPFDKGLIQRNQEQGRNISKDNEKSLPIGEKYPRVLEINLDAIKGAVEAISMGVGRKNRQTRSCPTSIKSSPLHNGFPSENKLYSKETSIQAAIAHCKRSFGQT